MTIPDSDPAIFSNANEEEAPDNGADQEHLEDQGKRQPPEAEKQRHPLPRSRKRKLIDDDDDGNHGHSSKGTDASTARGDFQNSQKRCKVTGYRRRCAKQKEYKRCATFQLSKPGGGESQAWTGEEELAQLYRRLEAARTETETLLSRSREAFSTWLRFVKLMKAIDVPETKLGGEEGSSSGPHHHHHSESIGDVSGALIAPLKEALDSWALHDRELETFQARVKGAICNRAFERRVEVPEKLRRRTADIPRIGEALDVLERLFEVLVCTLNTLVINMLDGDEDAQNDRVVDVTELALMQAKLAIDDLA
ncbi:uncharacterized protein PG986_011635 [Apiospora aurea]|uniref:Uncharacterized protein n=1 Tax=Apiospora aurea TaxID=335848 RepID=A0ABR1PXQ6_9PEZI